MWFEILPSAAIIFTCILAPQGATYVLNRIEFRGKPYRRPLETPYDQKMYLRDLHVAGGPYKTKGLSAIPDE